VAIEPQALIAWLQRSKNRLRELAWGGRAVAAAGCCSASIRLAAELLETCDAQCLQGDACEDGSQGRAACPIRAAWLVLALRHTHAMHGSPVFGPVTSVSPEWYFFGSGRNGAHHARRAEARRIVDGPDPRDARQIAKLRVAPRHADKTPLDRLELTKQSPALSTLFCKDRV
jgi:hypothetical protein